MLMDSVYNALMDSCLVFLALYSFTSLQMLLKRKISLCCMMGGGGAMYVDPLKVPHCELTTIVVSLSL
jgi:hypothetical protein